MKQLGTYINSLPNILITIKQYELDIRHEIYYKHMARNSTRIC